MEGFEFETEDATSGKYTRFIYTKKEGSITADEFREILAQYPDFGAATIHTMGDYSDHRSAITLDRYHDGHRKIIFWN